MYRITPNPKDICIARYHELYTPSKTINRQATVINRQRRGGKLSDNYISIIIFLLSKLVIEKYG